jgi:hypothetical protein
MNHQLWQTLIKYNVSPNQLYFLDCCRYKIKPTSIINADAESFIAESRGHLDKAGNLSSGAVFILDEFETLLAKTKKKVTSALLGVNALEQIQTYREMFPAKRLPKVGLLRQTVQELKEKFIWFFKTYPDFNWTLVLDATDYYMYTKQKENMEFVTTSSYFIQRTDTFTKVSRSLLADYCQMIVDNPEILNEA